MCGIETTPEYFERIAKDEELVRIATKQLENWGVTVTTEYGEYRPTYNVLRDLGEIWNSEIVNKDHIGEQKLCPRCSDEHHYIHYSHTGFYPSYICPKCGRRWYANEDE